MDYDPSPKVLNVTFSTLFKGQSAVPQISWARSFSPVPISAPSTWAPQPVHKMLSYFPLLFLFLKILKSFTQLKQLDIRIMGGNIGRFSSL